MARLLLMLIGALLLHGSAWAGDAISYRELLHRNNENSSKLSLGMTKGEVLSTMGNWSTEVRDGPLSSPWKTEAFVSGEDTIEVLYFLVKKHPPFTRISESQAIAAVIKNGSLVAWGRNAQIPFE